MSDMDVQDVRNLIAQKKAEQATQSANPAQLSSTMKGKGKDTSAAQGASGAAAAPAAPAAQGGQAYAAAEDAKRKREGMSKEDRLGL